jgi:IclR family pca regulon transcriptional regulator
MPSRPGSDVPEWVVPRLREPRYSQSLERGLAILGCFTPERPVLGIAGIADELGMSRSTTHRYVITLAALGYLEQDKSRKYRLGLKVTDLGMSVLNSVGLRDNANLYMRKLVQRANFTSSLAVLDGIDITIVERAIAQRRGYQKSARTVEVGSRLPAAVTSMGKLLLAHLPHSEQNDRLTAIKLKGDGPNTIRTKAALRTELQAIREGNLATDDEEFETGFHSIAAPVRDTSGEVVAALNLLAPQSTINLGELVSALGPHLIATADDIAARLGYRLESSENGHRDE